MPFCAAVVEIGRRSASERRSPLTLYWRAGNVSLRCPTPPRRFQIAQPMSLSPAGSPSSEIEWGTDASKRLFDQRAEVRYNFDRSIVRDRLRAHLAMIAEWSGYVSFKELVSRRSLFDVYIDLDLQVAPRYIVGSSSERFGTVTKLIDIPEHVMLLGDPGAGKTTSTKRLAQYYLDAHLREPSGAARPVLCVLN